MERRLAAILAADVVGYSRMMEADEVGTLAALKERRHAILDPLVARHRGRIVKVMGDGVLVEFASAVNAVACAVELQEKMATANAGLADGRHIILRIGINVGDLIVEGSDLYGDGVNVAARLEGLAGPGEIWIARAVHDQVDKKLAVAFEDLGPHEVKNLAKPVHVYRIGAHPSTVHGTEDRQASTKPSIVVLPFANMSSDPSQDYFSDGITENIITDLSRFRDLMVIARNSSFIYKGKAVKVQEVSRELCARFVLEGSVQRSANRVRITAQLIDGTTGRHLWAERYDREVEDIFAVQDEVTETIVGTLASGYGGRLRKAWQGRVEGKDTRSLQAIDYFQRGMEQLDRFTKEGCEQSRVLFQKAAELDPNYAKPCAKISWAHMVDALFGWSENPEESWRLGLRYANLAIERDDDEAWGHWALSGYHQHLLQYDRAIAGYQRALELNPNDADILTDFGLCLTYAGRSKEALEMALKAMRLNPHNPDWYVAQLGIIYFDARRYSEAISTLEALRSVDTPLSRLYLAASHAAADHPSEARHAIERFLAHDPRATLARWTSPDLAPYKNPSDLDHFRDNLRKAGLRE